MEGKKSVVIYTDWINIFEELEDVEAGQLIKHFFRYVNDKNPDAPSRLIKLVFEPLKQSLKRDLVKYETKRLKNSDNANMRWHKKNANACERIKVHANHADSVSVSDSDSVIIKEERKKKTTTTRQEDFYNSLIPFLDSHPKERIKSFYNYWSEITQDGKKMRFELEKTWEVSKRLTTWGNREKSDFKTPTKKEDKMYNRLPT